MARLPTVSDQAQLQVSWQQPATNGADIAGYELQVMQGSHRRTHDPEHPGRAAVAGRVGDHVDGRLHLPSAGEQQGGLERLGSDLIAAARLRRPGCALGRRQPGDRRLTVSYSPAAGNGATPGELRYEYSLNGGGWAALPGNNVITGLNNGTSYRVALRAYTALDGVRYDGPASAQSAAQIPYGPVGTPGATATRSGRDIQFGWSAPAENGRAITQVQISIDGSGWQNVANSGSRTNTYAYSTTHTIDVRAQDAAGQSSGVRSASATTVDPPQPRAWVTPGASAVGQPQLQHVDVRVLRAEHPGLPGRHVSRLLRERSRRRVRRRRPAGGPANGSVQLGCYYGKPGTQVWVRIEGWGESEHTTWY